MTQSYAPYLDFLRFSLHEQAEVPECVRVINWDSLLQFAKEQSIPGIYWMGVRRLGDLKENKPTDDHVMRWMAACGKLATRNQYVTEKSAWVAKNFQTEGFSSCLLKGQGLALYYPDPSLRFPGDIDIWVLPASEGKESRESRESRESTESTPSIPSSPSIPSIPSPLDPQGRFQSEAGKEPLNRSSAALEPSQFEGAIRTVIAYCRQFVPNAKACYHHIDFLKAGDVEVEVHYRPSWLNNPFHNRRLQEYFLDHADEQFANLQPQGFAVPQWDFNRIFLLSHIANHLLHEGIGLKQVIDYYYLLRSHTERKSIDSYEQEFRRLGLLPFARQLMWILCKVLGLDEQLLVARQDERRGRLLLSEMMASGNFGKYDDRPLSGYYSSAFKSNLQRLVRDLRMVRYFPSESLWEPVFRIHHYFWRKRH